VYGLVTSSSRDEYTARLYKLKGRDGRQPSALLAASVDNLFGCVPELREHAEVMILPNPGRRYPWLTGTRTDAIGVRVADLPPASARVVAGVCCVVATSANEPGEPSPATLDEVPRRIRDACAAEIDLGRLTGRPSTVIDFTGAEPFVVRDGAAPAADAIARVRRALAA
jgi:tRNA A37 threonylcarbamoyladenosine synthetase subunit TsaC/SUA5/YrdC